MSNSDNRLKEAYDHLKPDDKAKQRMLDNILAAAGKEQEDADDAPVQAPAPTPALTPLPQKKRSRRRPLLQIALPVAACLVLLAGVGYYVLPQIMPVKFGPSIDMDKSYSVTEKTPQETPMSEVDPQEPTTGEADQEPDPPGLTEDGPTVSEPAVTLPVEDMSPSYAAQEPPSKGVDTFILLTAGVLLVFAAAVIVFFVVLRRRRR